MDRYLTRTFRWRFLFHRGAVVIAVLAAAVMLVACGGDDDAGDSKDGGGPSDLYEVEADRVIFADYGGTTRAARIPAFFEPIQELTGARVVPADADPAKLELFVENERAEWDLIDTDPWDIVRFARAGFLAKLPPEVERSEAVPEEFRDYASGGYIASIVLGYNTESGPAPKSWADFFNTEKFPGKRAIPNFPGFLQLEAALLADGVPCDELYPLDFDRAFAKLDEIRDDLLFYDSFGKGMQFLAQGSVSMAMMGSGRMVILRDQGLPVDLVWNEALMVPWIAAVIPKHAPHKDAAFAMVDIMMKPENQAEFSRLSLYGPMNPDALELLDEDTLERLPNSPEHRQVACELDMVALAGQFDEYAERYSEWLQEG